MLSGKFTPACRRPPSEVRFVVASPALLQAFAQFVGIHSEFLDERGIECTALHAAFLYYGIRSPVGMLDEELVGISEAQVPDICRERHARKPLEKLGELVLWHGDDFQQLRAREVRVAEQLPVLYFADDALEQYAVRLCLSGIVFCENGPFFRRSFGRGGPGLYRFQFRQSLLQTVVQGKVLGVFAVKLLIVCQILLYLRRQCEIATADASVLACYDGGKSPTTATRTTAMPAMVRACRFCSRSSRS